MGLQEDLDWYESELGKNFKLKIRGRLGEKCELKDMRILNRIITLTKEGVLYEADPRHHELMIRNLGLSDAKGCVTPGMKPTSTSDEAPKEGAPEPWDDSIWQNDDDHVSALLADWNEYEAAKIAALDDIFKSREPKSSISMAMDVNYDAPVDLSFPERIEPPVEMHVEMPQRER